MKHIILSQNHSICKILDSGKHLKSPKGILSAFVENVFFSFSNIRQEDCQNDKLRGGGGVMLL